MNIIFKNQFDYQKLEQLNTVTGRYYVSDDGVRVPSVTTILSKTKDMTAINKWKKRVGEKVAQETVTEASNVGTLVHKNVENYILGNDIVIKSNLIHKKAKVMSDILIDKALSTVNNVYGLEQRLIYPGLYAGTTDMIAMVDSELCICDFKQSNKPKKREWIEDYFIQLCLYAAAHNETQGTSISSGHIFMVTRGNHPIEIGGEEYLHFYLANNEFKEFTNKAWNRVEQYYQEVLK